MIVLPAQSGQAGSRWPFVIALILILAAFGGAGYYYYINYLKPVNPDDVVEKCPICKHGYCGIKTGECICETGWGGTQCDQVSTGALCAAKNCGPNGQCKESGGKAVCECRNRYSGSECNIAPDLACQGMKCNEPNGNCENGQCLCRNGYSGKDCSITPPRSKGNWLSTDTTRSSNYLTVNEYLQSVNKKYYVILNDRGRLALYEGAGPGDPHEVLRWASATSDFPVGLAYHAVIQNDSNLCIYKGPSPTDRWPGDPLWCMSRHLDKNPNYVFVVQDNGTFCVYPGQAWPNEIGPLGCCKDDIGKPPGLSVCY